MLNGCGSGLGCGSCGGGCKQMGDASVEVPERFPAVEQILWDYIKSMMDSGQPFFITDELNSDSLSQAMGFWAEAAAFVTKAASTVGSTVVKMAPYVAKMAATSQQINAQYQQTLSQQGVNVPNAILPQTVAAAQQQNVLGTGMNQGTFLLVGGGLLALVLLMKK